jgi:hypothetical protein
MIKSRSTKWAEHVACIGTKGLQYGFSGKARRKEPPGRTKRRWEKNIKMDRREIGCGDMDWINQAQERD